MSITTDLLNTTITVQRVGNTLSDSGDSTYVKSNIYTGVPARITTNKIDYKSQHLSESGVKALTTHKIFVDNLYTIIEGDVVLHNSKQYIVRFVDDSPGGTQNHIELFVDLVKP